MYVFMFLLLINLNKPQRPRIRLVDNSNKELNTIPLINFQVDADVTGTTAQANYTLTYRSFDKNSLVEAKLKLPFDNDVIVSDVSLEYKDKILIGQIINSSNVNHVYNKEKQDKNVVMVVEKYYGYISIDLAGIEPNEIFTAKISTYTVLDLKFDPKEKNFFRRYAFPISMVPYYTPLNCNNEYENYKNPYLQLNVNYSFNFNLKTLDGRISSESISSIKSQSNGTIKWNDTSFSYSGEVPNDVIVDIISQSPNSSVEMIIEQFENSTVTEITIPHSFLKNIRKSVIQKKLNNNRKKSYVFLIDRSGSMQGEPIENAKSALELFLHSLPYDSYFEIVGFGYKYSPLFHTLVEYNDTTLEMAIKHVQSIKADMKGTEMLQPLKYILEQKPDHLILLTDGAVSNVDELKSYCSLFTTQISTIAIGNYAAKDLLKTISLRSMGTYESVDYVGQIEGAVIRSLSAMEDGVLISSIKSNCGILHQTFPILLLPDTISVFRFFNPNSYSQENVSIDLTVQDLSCQKEFSFTINQDNAIVKRIEGKKLHSTTLLRAINEYIIDEEEAFNESVRLGLLTSLTSFILVDKRSASEKEKYLLKSVEIPIKYKWNSYFPRVGGGSFSITSDIKGYQMLDTNNLYGNTKEDSKEAFSMISSLQKARGNWNLLDVLNALNIKLNETDKTNWLNKKNENGKDSLLAGLFAIEYLQNDYMGIYKLVIEKGNSFIQAKFPTQMIDLAQKVVKKYLKISISPSHESSEFLKVIPVFGY